MDVKSNLMLLEIRESPLMENSQHHHHVWSAAKCDAIREWMEIGNMLLMSLIGDFHLNSEADGIPLAFDGTMKSSFSFL